MLAHQCTGMIQPQRQCVLHGRFAPNLTLADSVAQGHGNIAQPGLMSNTADRVAFGAPQEFLLRPSKQVREVLTGPDVTADTVVALTGIASLFGFLRVSHLVREVEAHIRGNLLVFFPGAYHNNNYRLMDARDGWNYLAVPITES